MIVPDKYKFKSTITTTLRNDIINLAQKFKENRNVKPRYLEVGFDRGYTLYVLHEAKVFSELVGIDISHERMREASTLLGNSVSLHLCDIHGLQHFENKHFDIVFIDADHTYNAIKNDVLKTLKFNTADEYYLILHDYGLTNAGVKQVVHEIFHRDEINIVGDKDHWNPLGAPINDVEAVYMLITNEIRDRILQQLNI